METVQEKIELDSIVAQYGQSYSIKEFLKSHLGRWPEEHKVRLEILYLNEEQMLLEQIAEFGFAATRETMRVREVSQEDFLGMGLCAYVAATGESVLVREVMFDKRYKSVATDDNTVSELVVALKLGKRTIGVLNLEGEVAGAFGRADLDYFENIAPLLALIIEHETYRIEEEFLKRAVAAISPLSDSEAILEESLDQVLSLVGPECLGAVLIPAGGGRDPNALKVLISRGLDLEPGDVRQVKSLGVIRQAIQNPSGQRYWSFKEGDLNYVSLAVNVKSEFAKVLRVGDRVVALLDIESRYTAITERFQRVIRRFSDHTATLLYGLEKKGELERKKGMEVILEAVTHEMHNAAGTFGVLYSNIKNMESESPGLMPLFEGIQGRLTRTHKMVSGFVKPAKAISLRRVLEPIEHYARQLDVFLTCSGALDIAVVGNEVGLRWLFENLILNTKRHGNHVAKRQAWIAADTEGENGILLYWDNGEAPRSLEDFWKGRTGRKGVKLVRALCDRFAWKASVRSHENGGLQYEFKFPYLASSVAE